MALALYEVISKRGAVYETIYYTTGQTFTAESEDVLALLGANDIIEISKPKPSTLPGKPLPSISVGAVGPVGPAGPAGPTGPTGPSNPDADGLATTGAPVVVSGAAPPT